MSVWMPDPVRMDAGLKDVKHGMKPTRPLAREPQNGCGNVYNVHLGSTHVDITNRRQAAKIT